MIFTIGTGGTLPALSTNNVLTTGIAGLDFTLGTGSTCTGAVTAGQTCTVNVAFTPAAAGVRRGAVKLLNSSGAVLATAYISGTGTAPVAAFQSGVASTVLSGLNQPYRAIFDAAGYMYVVDAANHTVKKYAPGSTTGVAISSSFSHPEDIALDGAGTLFVADTGTGSVVTVSPSGVQSTVGVSGAFKVTGLAVDGAGYVYEVESCSGSSCPIRKILGTAGASGTWTTIGTYPYNQSGHMALDLSGNLLIAAGTAIYTLPLNSAVATAMTFTGYTPSLVMGIAVDAAGNTFLADNGSKVLYEAPASGDAVVPLATGVQFEGVSTVAGRVYYTDLTNGRVSVLNRSTTAPLAFPATPLGATASQTVVFENDGNAALNFSVPNTGYNPAVTGPYSLGSSSTCPQVSASGMVQALSAGTACTEIVQFQPVVVAASNPGSVTNSDKSNNVASTQSFTMSGASTPGSQTISFPQPAPAVAGTTATLTATGGASANPVTFSITGGTGSAVLSGVNNATITYTSAGTVQITASQAGDANYNAATPVVDTVTVAPAPTAYSPPQTTVGQTSAVQTAYVTITTAGTVANIGVLTQGISGLDYAFVSGGTCTTSAAYSVGQVCSVLYTFTPGAPGPRPGAIQLHNGTTQLGLSMLSGTGSGPAIAFPGNVQVSGLGSFSQPVSAAVDAAGNVYFTLNYSLEELIAVNGVVTATS